jgi:hypothetical protein
MALNDDLAELHPAPEIARLLQDISNLRSVESDRRSDYLSLRPSPVGAIALFAHAGRVAIAKEPHLAVKNASRLHAATLRRATPATTYLLVDEQAIGQAHDVVLELALAAVDWRESGPPLTLESRTGQASARPVEICANGWQVITPSGACGCCQ